MELILCGARLTFSCSRRVRLTILKGFVALKVVWIFFETFHGRPTNFLKLACLLKQAIISGKKEILLILLFSEDMIKLWVGQGMRFYSQGRIYFNFQVWRVLGPGLVNFGLYSNSSSLSIFVIVHSKNLSLSNPFCTWVQWTPQNM